MPRTPKTARRKTIVPDHIDPMDKPVHGASAIGRVLNLTPMAVYHRFYRGELDGIVHKVGEHKHARLISTPRQLLAHANGTARKAEPLDAA